MNADIVIDAKNVVKKFGSVKALDGLDLTVKRGHIHGFLGPNGAGKSTTIRILLGLLRKNSGHVALLGQDPWRDSVALHRRLAYIPSDVQLWPQLSGGETIDLLCALRGHSNQARRNALISDFKLDPRKKCGTYSTGNRQKVAIIAALTADVELYIMDEPTAGLDPLMQSVFNQHVLELKKQGKTVLLSSHILDEVQTLCDHITIIKDGRTIESGSLAELRSLTELTIEIETERKITGLNKIQGVTVMTQRSSRATLKAAPEALTPLLAHLSTFGVRSLTSAPVTLEELFLKLYRTEKR